MKDNEFLNTKLKFLEEGYLGFDYKGKQYSWPSSDNFIKTCIEKWYPYFPTASFKRFQLETAYKISMKLVEKKYLNLTVGNFIELVHEVANLI